MNEEDLKLFEAMSSDHHEGVEELEQLTDDGADPTCVDTGGGTCLHEAASWGFVSNMQWLVSNYDFDIDVRTEYGNTPLHSAAENGNLAAMIWLVKHGADMNATNNGSVVAEDLLRENYPELLPKWHEFVEGVKA